MSVPLSEVLGARLPQLNNSIIWAPIKAVFLQEVLLSLRNPQQWLNPIIFFVMIISLFPLGISPSKEMLSAMAVGVIWIAVILASMLAADKLFKADLAEGTLEQLVLSSVPLTLVVQAKLAGHWLFTGLPMVLLAPLLSVFMFLEVNLIKVLMVTLLLGTPIITFINAIGAAITLCAHGGGVVLLLICLPLQIPVIIFSTGAVYSAINQQDYMGQLAVLGALFCLFVFLAPFAIAAALKVGVCSQ